MEELTRLIQVELTAADGSRLGQQDVEVRPRPEERLLAIVSSQPVPLVLPRRQELERLPFVVVEVPLATLPPQERGLSSLTLLLLHDIDTELLDETQHRALLAWVAGWRASGDWWRDRKPPDRRRTAACAATGNHWRTHRA
ncbi:MAG: hypothetical protein HC893_11070 [Chloroflexaceae bacterium]|nr:hypothetical protein [Chloroflexaceae bacterium]